MRELRDSAFRALTRGEYVVRRSAVDRVGVGYLDQLNAGRTGFNKGGVVAKKKPAARPKPKPKPTASGTYLVGANFRANESTAALAIKISQQEAALMRALGASRSQILATQRTEFAVLGLLAGLLAALGATGIGYLIATKVFQFPYQVNHWIWLAGPIAGLACVSLNAWAGARAALNHPPLLALRET